MENQFEFEPSASNFLDEGFSNLKGKEKRKAKKAARKEKRATKKAVRQEKRAARKGGATVATPLAEGSSESAERESASPETASTTKTEGATAGASTGAETKTESATTDSTSTSTTTKDDAATTAGATTGGDKGGDDEKGGGTGITPTEEKKILGMKPMVAYGVFALVAVGGFFVVRSMMKGKGTPAVATA